MKRSLMVLAILAFSATTAAAAPGDPRVVEGVLEWPSSLSAEPFVVIRGNDGRLYYTDISAAQRRIPGPLTSGTRIAVLGVEGVRPHEVAAMAFGAGDASALGVTPATITSPASSPASLSSPATVLTPGPPAEPLWRLDGTVQSIAGNVVTVRTPDGGSQSVDVMALSDATIRALQPGERVTLFGVPRPDRKLVANGYIQSEPAAPSASPRSTR
jgi:hypothetical protein